MKFLIALFLVTLFSLSVGAATLPCGTSWSSGITSGDWIESCPDFEEADLANDSGGSEDGESDDC